MERFSDISVYYCNVSYNVRRDHGRIGGMKL